MGDVPVIDVGDRNKLEILVIKGSNADTNNSFPGVSPEAVYLNTQTQLRSLEQVTREMKDRIGGIELQNAKILAAYEHISAENERLRRGVVGAVITFFVGVAIVCQVPTKLRGVIKLFISTGNLW